MKITIKFTFELTPAQLKVFSAIFSNFVVVWLIAILGTRDILALTLNLLAAILSWYLAVRAEEIFEET